MHTNFDFLARTLSSYRHIYCFILTCLSVLMKSSLSIWKATS